MNISTILGLIVGLATMVGGMILKGASVGALFNPAALVIIFVGTFAALLNAFPMNEVKKIPVFAKLILMGNNTMEPEDVATEFVDMSLVTRKEGVLALEKREFDDPFMRTAVGLLVDGTSPEILEEVLDNSIAAMQERHKLGIQMFSQAGMYAPTLGVLGAVIGLVAALGNLNDIDALGHSIAAAFIATMFGIFSGYVLWHPFANKLKQMSKAEVEVKRMIMEGVLSIQAGNSPAVVQTKMLAYISENKREELMNSWGK